MTPRLTPSALRLAATALLSLAASAAHAQQNQPAQQAQQAQRPAAYHDRAALKRTVEEFLQVQTGGLPGQVTVAVGAIDPRMSLAPCPAPQAFFMPGARAWGKTTVGVRCATPAAWTVYIQASVTVIGEYVASAAPLAQGQTIEAGQLVMLKGDLTMLPAGIATDINQVVGRSSNSSLPPGTPMRVDTLRIKPVVQSGQLVRLVSSGAGFSVSAEARAMGTAGDGQVVQVKTSGGQQITGIAKAGGLVEVAF
ncbi:flagella basal body P-ring formation protein FlgA [Duganella sp. 1411]|uniref:flagellar basal body P-ring formation chaperone FlgA n=1 Tax=Duganella sp. 1411 TaxID=2806572 RepID=UPI001AE2AB1F|nr:flagellar basal body P-ring formation chaperone FlgA [Duganella sp. 1411]MBP1208068.1 flagella basal body P-ring formation protein FlgA [Duganella sp. 1411]